MIGRFDTTCTVQWVVSALGLSSNLSGASVGDMAVVAGLLLAWITRPKKLRVRIRTAEVESTVEIDRGRRYPAPSPIPLAA